MADRLSLAQPDPDSTLQPALPRVNPIGPADTDGPRPQEVETISSLASKLSQKDDPLPPEPPAKELQFIPKFKGAAEMEARRKLRMLARRGQASANPKPASDVNKYLNPEISSDDDDGILEDDDNVDDFDDLVDRADDMDEGDEFDPYAPLHPSFPRMPDSRTVTLLPRVQLVSVSTVPLTQVPSCQE